MTTLSEPSSRIALRCAIVVTFVASVFVTAIHWPDFLATCALRTDRSCLPELVQFGRLFWAMLLLVTYLAAFAFRIWVRQVSICCLATMAVGVTYEAVTLLPVLVPAHKGIYAMLTAGRAVVAYAIVANLRDYALHAEAMNWSETRLHHARDGQGSDLSGRKWSE